MRRVLLFASVLLLGATGCVVIYEDAPRSTAPRGELLYEGGHDVTARTMEWMRSQSQQPDAALEQLAHVPWERVEGGIGP